jgi:uncharacterized protein (TIGR02246 family)
LELIVQERNTLVKSRLAILAVVGTFLLLASGAWADKDTSGEEKALQARAKEFIEAFNKGDADALAAFWTPDGDYVDQVGTQLKGREAIQKAFQKQFAVLKGAKLRIHRSGVKFVKDDLAIEDGTTEVIPADGGPPTTARYTIVHVKQDGQWMLSSVRDSVAVAPSQARHLEDLAWIIGEWEAKTKEGEVHANYSWDDSGNFIVSSLAATLKSVPVTGSTQWIAWDPSAKCIRSWSFLSQGGFTQAVWKPDGNKWTVEVKGTLRDGKKATATNVITQVDADNATWQQTNLTVDGKSMPERPAINLKRVKPTPDRGQ